MKSHLVLLAIIILPCINLKGQTLIGTTQYETSLANRTQRKIIRDANDNVYVFASMTNSIWIGQSNYDWGWEEILIGNNPSAAIGHDNTMHLVFESTDDTSQIMYSLKPDTGVWSTPLALSTGGNINILPVADVDSASVVHVVWLEQDVYHDRINYIKIYPDSISQIQNLYSDNAVSDVSVATNLQYFDNTVYITYAVGEGIDKDVYFICSSDYGNTWQGFNYSGTLPCISIGLYPEPVNYEYSQPKLFFLDNEKNAVVKTYCDTFSTSSEYIEVDNYSDYIIEGQVTDIFIDNVIPPLGFGFIYLKDGYLIQGFTEGSYHFIMDTISDNPINPGIAYKQFCYNKIDYVWMEDNGTGYDIYYGNSDKIPTALPPEKTNNTEYLRAYPNPFSAQITFYLNRNWCDDEPDLSIYNIEGKKVALLKAEGTSNGFYTYKWNSNDIRGDTLPAGQYFVHVRTGNNKKISRMIILLK